MAWPQLQPQALLMALSLLTQPLLLSISSQPASLVSSLGSDRSR